MLTYATVQEFLDMKNIGKTGLITVSNDARNKIQTYLDRATRFVKKNARRDFLPYIETTEYPVPYAFYDLLIRRFPNAHLKTGKDLLEVITLNNGIEDLDTSDYFTLEHNVYPKVIIAVRYPKYWGGLSGSVGKRYDDSVITLTGIFGYADGVYPLDYWIDTLEVVPSGGITSSQTSIVLTDVDGYDIDGETRFLSDKLIRIDNEFMEVTNVNTSTNTITVIRGIRGSTAAAHEEDTKIYRWRIPYDIVDATLKIAATWRETSVQVGNRIGVSDVSSDAEMGIPQDAMTIIKSYQRSFLLD